MNLHSDRFLLRQYTYNETQEVIELNKQGESQKTRVRSYEVFPSTVEELIYRRLISKDGKPVEQKELRKQDKKYNKRVQKYAKKGRKRGLQAGSEYEAGEAEALREEKQLIEEMLRLYRFEIHGREVLEGYSTLIVRFTPRPGFKSKLKDIKILRKVQGRVWVSEQDYQPVKVEAETLESLKFGWGIVAKLNSWKEASFWERKRTREQPGGADGLPAAQSQRRNLATRSGLFSRIGAHAALQGISFPGQQPIRGLQEIHGCQQGLIRAYESIGTGRCRIVITSPRSGELGGCEPPQGRPISTR